MTYTIIALTIIYFVLKLVDHEQCEAGIVLSAYPSLFFGQIEAAQ